MQLRSQPGSLLQERIERGNQVHTACTMVQGVGCSVCSMFQVAAAHELLSREFVDRLHIVAHRQSRLHRVHVCSPDFAACSLPLMSCNGSHSAVGLNSVHAVNSSVLSQGSLLQPRVHWMAVNMQRCLKRNKARMHMRLIQCLHVSVMMWQVYA